MTAAVCVLSLLLNDPSGDIPKLARFTQTAGTQTPTTPENDATEATREDREYVENFLFGIFMVHLSDPTELPAMKEDLLYLQTKINGKQIMPRALLASLSGNEENMVIRLDWNDQRDKAILNLILPAMRRQQTILSPGDFSDFVAVMFAIEAIAFREGENSQLTPANPPTIEDNQKTQAAIFGKAIVQIVRPLQGGGRFPLRDWAEMSKQLSETGDDYGSEKWIAHFKPPVTIKQ